MRSEQHSDRALLWIDNKWYAVIFKISLPNTYVVYKLDSFTEKIKNSLPLSSAIPAIQHSQLSAKTKMNNFIIG